MVVDLNLHQLRLVAVLVGVAGLVELVVVVLYRGIRLELVIHLVVLLPLNVSMILLVVFALPGPMELVELMEVVR